MNTYDRRQVLAPEWMEDFRCIAGNCPDTCCRGWNIEVDPYHAELFTRLPDPDLRKTAAGVLRGIRVRRPGEKKAEINYRLSLTNQPDERCALLNQKAECRLQKQYGPYVLCDTCYFHPRCFWQVDERTYMSACLSCPECARLALLPTDSVEFTTIETEIDPGAEWLETDLIPGESARALMREREEMIRSAIQLLQDRRFPPELRVQNVIRFYAAEAGSDLKIYAEEEGMDDEQMMRLFMDVFISAGDEREKPVREAEDFLFSLAGGKTSFAALLAENYRAGCGILDPFLQENEHLMENFLVHCLFSDGFKQFYRCQNEVITAEQILERESALLVCWYWLIRACLAQAALSRGKMTETIFLQTVIAADRNFWHYPDWFSRRAEKLTGRNKK